ncbi:hypothetical protein [Streptomyces sp. S186]|uniref:hypothetical protein n=1 Tax=Streptomyces sp. S186 TaxID=3434395 RepID=UPI003F671077
MTAPAANAMGLVQDFATGSGTSVSGDDHGRGDNDHGRGRYGDRDRDHGRYGDRDRDHGGWGDRDRDHGGYGDRDNGRDHGYWGGHHRHPHGGVHTGGGALADVVVGDWDNDYGDNDHGRGRDHGRDRDHGRWGDRDRDNGGYGDRDNGGWGHDHWGRRPHGGVHTGGGGMAMSGSGLAAGSVLMLGGLGAGAYMLRRRNTSGTAA